VPSGPCSVEALNVASLGFNTLYRDICVQLKRLTFLGFNKRHRDIFCACRSGANNVIFEFLQFLTSSRYFMRAFFSFHNKSFLSLLVALV